MNTVAQVIGWVTILLFAVYLWLATVVTLLGTVQEAPSNPKAVYHWECMISQDNPFFPWKLVMSNKAEDPGSCGKKN